MHATPQQLDTREKMPQLDALRGICALMVALHHIEFQWPCRMTGLMRHGALFVDFFFVLSGFIIAYNYKRIATGAELGRFMWLRFMRVYPLHVLMLLVFLAYETAQWLVVQRQHLALGSAPFSDNDSAGFLLNLTLLNGVGLRGLSFNIPAWSISTEFWTYLLFGSIVLACAGREQLRNWLFAAIALAAFAVLCLGNPEPSLTYDYRFFLPRCVLGFFLGALLLSWLDLRGKPTRLHGMSATLAQVMSLSVAVAIVVAAWPAARELELAAPFAFVFVVGAFARFPETPLARFLVRRPLVWIGRVSYSIYMVHMIVLLAIEAFLRYGLRRHTEPLGIAISPAFGLALVPVYLACVLGAAALTYRFVEAPARAFGRELLQARRLARVTRKLESGGAPAQPALLPTTTRD
jgi:peptidoglycan/LPS O-acetylase OafA/YrhL